MSNAPHKKRPPSLASLPCRFRRGQNVCDERDPSRFITARECAACPLRAEGEPPPQETAIARFTEVQEALRAAATRPGAHCHFIESFPDAPCIVQIVVGGRGEKTRVEYLSNDGQWR